MNTIYSIVSIFSIIVCICEIKGRKAHCFEIYIVALVIRLAVRLLDLEGSLEAGYDRQFFALIILSNSLVAQMTLSMLFIFFRYSHSKLATGMFLAIFMCGCATFGELKLINELQNMKLVSYIMLAFFPLLMLVAMILQKNAEEQWRGHLDKIQLENEFHYVLDLLQESIAIIDDSKTSGSKKNFEYVNNCFLKHFKNIIEDCSSNEIMTNQSKTDKSEEGLQQPAKKIEIFDASKGPLSQNGKSDVNSRDSMKGLTGAVDYTSQHDSNSVKESAHSDDLPIQKFLKAKIFVEFNKDQANEQSLK